MSDLLLAALALVMAFVALHMGLGVFVIINAITAIGCVILFLAKSLTT